MGETDGRLLARFVSERDEAAFEELVQRHGAMVYGVCRRVLGNLQDAEDAFQAAFMVLAQNAGKLRKTESPAGWLHGIALRVALNAKRRAARRRERERQVVEMAEMSMTEAEQEKAWRDTEGVLDEELSRMPEKLRAPLLLCYFENKTNEEAARELGWSDGELRGRLAKGREVLRGRLSRKGIVLGAAALFALISQKASAASVPPVCVASTVKAAAALAAGKALASGVLSAGAAALAAEAMKALLWAKIKIAAAAFAVSAVVLCGGALVLKEALTAGEGQGAAPQPVPLQAATAEPGGTAVAEPGPETAAAPADVVEPPERLAVPEGLLPEAVMKSLGGLYPGATVVRVKEEEEDGLFVYEVELDVDGIGAEAEVTAEGKILRSEEEIDADDLPEAVLQAVNGLHPEAAVREAARIFEGAAVSYEVDLTVEGRTIKIRLSPEGEVVEQEDEGEEEHEGGNEEVGGAGDGPAGKTGAELF